MALIEIQNLNFTYNGSDRPALSGVTLNVESGDFVLLFGRSGCGKTTLLKLLKKQLSPAGRISGAIAFNGQDISLMEERDAVSQIGYVTQNPESQTVTDKVWHELAFGPESLGEDGNSIRRKVAEICGFFGIGEWYHSSVCQLSGGQKQLLALASVMVMNPAVLLLDEPCAQLDPIAASGFIGALKRINDELGVTVIIAEHRLEELFPVASRAVLMEEGKIVASDSPRLVAKGLWQGDIPHPMCYGLPAAVRLYYSLGNSGECPLTVKEGKRFLGEYCPRVTQRVLPVPEPAEGAPAAVEIAEGYFRYERDLPDILSGLNLTVYSGELLCILGANGAGKTTLLRVLSGVKRLYKGKYRLWGKKLKEYTGNTLYRGNVACLTQNPQNLFVKSTLQADLTEAAKLAGQANPQEAVERVSKKLGIAHLYQSHPYDLSGGEQQRAALAKVLLMEPRILLLDEPTKGLDAHFKRQFAKIINGLKSEGKTIVLVTHDVEFAAEYADRCAMFFDGKIVSVADRVSFFAENNYYTTAAARITRPVFQNAVTVDMACELCRLNGGEK